MIPTDVSAMPLTKIYMHKNKLRIILLFKKFVPKAWLYCHLFNFWGNFYTTLRIFLSGTTSSRFSETSRMRHSRIFLRTTLGQICRVLLLLTWRRHVTEFLPASRVEKGLLGPWVSFEDSLNKLLSTVSPPVPIKT